MEDEVLLNQWIEAMIFRKKAYPEFVSASVGAGNRPMVLEVSSLFCSMFTRRVRK